MPIPGSDLSSTGQLLAVGGGEEDGGPLLIRKVRNLRGKLALLEPSPMTWGDGQPKANPSGVVAPPIPARLGPKPPESYGPYVAPR